MGLFDWWENTWDDLSGNTARRQQEEAMRTAQTNNAAALTAEQQALQKQLDFQKVLAYFQLMQGNQQGTLANQMAAQQLAGTLAGQQQAANQFAQLYNQDMANNLPQMQARLAALQALGPLMQMTGLQAYQMPTSLDTTKLTAPDIIGQFDTLSSKYASQYNPASLQNAQKQEASQFLQAMSDPAAWLATQGTAGTSAPGAALPTNIRASAAPSGSIRGPGPGATTAPAIAAGGTATPTPTTGSIASIYNPATTPATMTPLSPVSGALQGSQLETDPVYQFRLQQAQRELNNRLAARGQATGGVATEAGTNLALGMARDESNEKYNRLMNLVNLGMGGQMTQAGTNAGQQLAGMYQQGAQSTSNALANIGQAQNQAAQNRSGIYSGLANAYGQNAAAGANSLANYYGANSAAAQQYGNWASQQPSGLTRMLDLGTKLYGAYTGMGFGGNSGGGNYGYFGPAYTASGNPSWSNPTGRNLPY